MKLLRITIVMSTCAGLLLAACADGDSNAGEPVSPPALVGDATAGKMVYEGTCVACHGPGAVGITGLGKDWTVSDFIRNNSDADLMAFIKQGRLTTDSDNTTGVDMPAMGGNNALTDKDLADVIAYMRTVQK
jgi:mono/diheme cytochrome c family protein